MKKILIIIICFLALSCTKEKPVKTESESRLTTLEAKNYYENLSKTHQIKFLNGETAPLSAVITPNWKRALEITVNSYSIVEIPIRIPRNEISTYQLNGENTNDNIKRSKFSLSRLIIYKKSKDSLTSNIITYIPDISYIEKGKDIHENTFSKISSSFTGYIEFKKIDGQPYRLLRIKNGKLTGKYNVNSSSVQKQARVNTEMSTSSSCFPMCTPIFQTICAGPGGPGTGDESDWTCETQEIGQNCIIVCNDGGGNYPDPGDGGNPGTPGIFGINGSNAVVPVSNFGALLNYVKTMGYMVSDQFATTLNVNGVSYQGTMVEIYSNDGKVISAYFHSNEFQGPFTGDYYYNIGKGNGANTSDSLPIYFIEPAITGSDITWTNGTSSYASVSVEAIPNLSDTDPEIAAWNEAPNPQHGVIAAPSYSTMYANYPKNSTGGDMPAPKVYELVGGNIFALYQSDPVKYANACALRVSRALNYSGIQIPYIPGKTTSGGDGKYYFVSSAHLYTYVKQIFSSTYKVVLTGSDGGPEGKLFREKLKYVKGLYFMQPNYPSKFGAMGHATLWTGSMAIGGHDYFNGLGGVAKVTVWRLP